MNHDRSSQLQECRLSAEDGRVLDALVEAEFELERAAGLTEADRLRARRIMKLLGLMNDYPVDDADRSLIHATLARIDRHEDEQAARLRFGAEGQGAGVFRGRRLRLPDFISAAAVLLMVVGVMWPMLHGMRQRAVDDQCANNLRNLGYAFSVYANDNNGAVPMVMAGPMGAWDSFRNVLNLKPLVDGGYCAAGHLNCPGHHEQAAPSYSYRWFLPKNQPSWGAGRVTVVMGDLNPVIEGLRQGQQVPILSTSINHPGRGQNVLVIDGSTLWLTQPVLTNGDNIWVPDHVSQLVPGFVPQDDQDVFLAQ